MKKLMIILIVILALCCLASCGTIGNGIVKYDGNNPLSQTKLEKIESIQLYNVDSLEFLKNYENIISIQTSGEGIGFKNISGGFKRN